MRASAVARNAHRIYAGTQKGGAVGCVLLLGLNGSDFCRLARPAPSHAVARCCFSSPLGRAAHCTCVRILSCCRSPRVSAMFRIHATPCTYPEPLSAEPLSADRGCSLGSCAQTRRGPQIAKKMTGSLFESKNRHSHHNIGIEPSPSVMVMVWFLKSKASRLYLTSPANRTAFGELEHVESNAKLSHCYLHLRERIVIRCC